MHVLYDNKERITIFLPQEKHTNVIESYRITNDIDGDGVDEHTTEKKQHCTRNIYSARLDANVILILYQIARRTITTTTKDAETMLRAHLPLD